MILWLVLQHVFFFEGKGGWWKRQCEKRKRGKCGPFLSRKCIWIMSRIKKIKWNCKTFVFNSLWVMLMSVVIKVGHFSIIAFKKFFTKSVVLLETFSRALGVRVNRFKILNYMNPKKNKNELLRIYLTPFCVTNNFWMWNILWPEKKKRKRWARPVR